MIGRVARPDADKWSSNTWRIYDRIAHRHRQALVMGVDERTLAKLGPPPQDHCRPVPNLLTYNWPSKKAFPQLRACPYGWW